MFNEKAMADSATPTSVRMDIIDARCVSEADYAQWAEILDAQSVLESPFFSPQFVQTLAHSVPNGFVAKQINNDRTEAFFAFQVRGQALQPFGAPICDYHQVAIREGAEFHWPVLFEALERFTIKLDQFNGSVRATTKDLERRSGSHRPKYTLKNLTLSLPALFNARVVSDNSNSIGRYAVDLRRGFKVWDDWVRAQDHRYFKDIDRCERKIARDRPDIVFQKGPVTPDVLHWILAQKRDQYQRSGLHDVFHCGWTASALEALSQADETADRNAICLECGQLRAGPEIIAAEIYLRGKQTAHFWFPAFDPNYRRFSPGIVLSYGLIRALSQEGITLIDYGTDAEGYKNRFTAQVDTGQAFVTHDGLNFFAFAASGLSQRLFTITACETTLKGRIKAYGWIAKRLWVRLKSKAFEVIQRGKTRLATKAHSSGSAKAIFQLLTLSSFCA